MKPFVIATLVALLALPAVAGERANQEKRADKTEAPEGKRDELRARVQEKIGTWLTTEISTRVSLDSSKSAKLSESIRAHMQRKQVRGKQLRQEMQLLRALVDGKAPDAQVKSQLDVVIGVSSRDDDVHELLRETARFMSVQEQARLALAMPEIMQELKKVMRETRREGRGKRTPPGGFAGAPPETSLEDDEL